MYEQEESESERDPNRWGSEPLVDNLTGLGGDRTQFDLSCSSINPSCTHTHTHMHSRLDYALCGDKDEAISECEEGVGS